MTQQKLNPEMQRICDEMIVAQAKADDSLSRYKFQMFGYWAAIWVHLNRIGEFKQPNPWSDLVRAAKVRATSSVSSHGQAELDGLGTRSALHSGDEA